MLFVLACTIVLAGNVDIIYFKDKSTGADLTNVQYLLYTCPNIDCTSVNTLVQNLNSGTNNYVTYEYASTERLFYGAYMFKACYLPYEDGFENWGDGGTYPFTYEFEKATSCHSPIDSFSITNDNYANEPVVINMQATLEADAHSAFSNAELIYTPTGFDDYYSAETKITLEILNDSDDVVYTDTQTYEIFMDTSQNVQFTWTPDIQGDYTARVTTNVVDCQCQSNFPQFSEKQFLVWPARPQDECYTIINDLEATPEFAKEGDLVTIRFNKISNYADNAHAKTPVQTAVTYEILNNGNIVYTDTATLNANANGNDYEEITFQWVPGFGGDFSIKVTGVCDSALCIGKTNPEDIEILGFFVESTPTYDVTFVVEDLTGNSLEGALVNYGTQTGLTNSVGEVVFESNIGTFDWGVSLANYETETGNTNVVDSDVLVNVQLAEIAPGITTLFIDYPTGGEVLKGLVNVLWTAANTKGHTLLIDLEYSLDGGFIWNTISLNEPNGGNYTWNTTAYADDDDYLLRLKATDTLTALFVYNQTPTTFEIDNIPNPKKGKSKDSDNCVPEWVCSAWSDCINSVKTRTCSDTENCGIDWNRPIEKMSCQMPIYETSLVSLEPEAQQLDIEQILILILAGAILLGLIILVVILMGR